MIELRIDQNVLDRWSGDAVLAVCQVEGCQNTHSLGKQFDQEVDATLREIRANRNRVLDEPRVQKMRATFKAMPDMDPSRYRPASESLLRRCLEKDLFRIKPLVDVNNLLSLGLRLPLGIYDLDQLPASPWIYRLGFSGEQYATISQQLKSAEGKLVLADGSGVFGSPVSDSGRAAIADQTTRVAVVAYLPLDATATVASEVCAEIENAFVRHFRPNTTHRQVVPAVGGTNE